MIGACCTEVREAHPWRNLTIIYCTIVLSGIGRGWSCRAGIGQSEGAWVHQGYTADTAGVDRGDICTLQSERVCFTRSFSSKQ